MDSPEDVRRALERLQAPVEGRTELVVTYRRYDDYVAYEHELSALRAKCERLERDVYQWCLMGNRFLEATDELHRLEELLRRHNISF